MSGLPIDRARHDYEEPRRGQLLAMHEVRRDLERLAAARTAVLGQGLALIPSQRARALHELIAALDRRVPGGEHMHEASIASDAAALRVEALKQIAELDDHIVAVLPRSMLAQEKAAAE